ncbi:MAG: GspE/PulE family protein, partial [Planctomycetales bacterium]
GASDLHLQPLESSMEIRWRIDGALRHVGLFPSETSTNIVARLKVLADLLTYRTDVPQEGRLRAPSIESGEVPAAASEVEMRISTFPTLHGERAVVRLFPGAGRYRHLADLGYPPEILEQLLMLLQETAGAILVTGPAGSGKTTSLYACLRHLAADSETPRNLVSLEDPIEVAVPGVAQAQVNETVELDLESGLRFLLRQDPEVVMVGEIRDRTTAQMSFQASLSGHLLLTSFHAGSACGAVSRLSDMGVEPYLLRSGALAILSQRLVRKLCGCAEKTADASDLLGLPVENALRPVGCEKCGGSGYRGRLVLAEILDPRSNQLGRAILSRADADRLEEVAESGGMITRWTRGCEAVNTGLTSPREIRRVLGFSRYGE